MFSVFSVLEPREAEWRGAFRLRRVIFSPNEPKILTNNALLASFLKSKLCVLVKC